MRELRALLRLAKPLLPGIVLAVFLGTATVSAGVGLMAAAAWLIATASFHPPLGDLQMAIVAVRFFGVSRGAFRYAERVVTHSMTFRVLARLRVWFFERLAPLVPARTGGLYSGDLLARAVGDIESLEGFFVRVLAPPLTALVAGTALVIFFAFYGRAPALIEAGVFLAAGAGIPLAALALARRDGPLITGARAALGRASIELVQGLPDLVAAGRTRDAVTRAVGAGRRLTGALRRRAVRDGALEAAAGTLAQLGILAIFLAVLPAIRSGRLSGVGLAVIVLAALAGFEAIEPLPSAAASFREQRSAMARLLEITGANPAVTDPPIPLTIPAPWPADLPAIVMEHLRFTYPGAPAPALDGIDLDIAPGSAVAIVGASGAGKTTIIELLLRFWEGWEGRLELAGQDIRRYAADGVRAAFAVVSQRTHLFTATIRNNLLLARPGAANAELWHALEAAGLSDDVHAMPGGLETWIGEQGLALSGGQRQRLAIARAVLRDAPILLLDEPTTHLDTVTERQVLGALERIAAGRTTIMLTHRLTAMERYDTIVVLDRGRIAERGTHAELLAAHGLYRQMWDIAHREFTPA